MLAGRDFIGKPVFSISDGRRLGTLKDLYVDRDLRTVVGISLGTEGLFGRKELCISRDDVTLFGMDAILVKQSDVIVDGAPTCESGTWLRRDQLPGRRLTTAGGTLVGSIDDIILDEETQIVGFRLGRVYVKGPVAENRAIIREAVIDVGDEEAIIIDLPVAERQSLKAK